jgi:hypothetical protein
MDMLEEKGIIGPPTETGPRDILIDLDGGIPEHAGNGEFLSEAEAPQDFFEEEDEETEPKNIG